MKPYGDDLYSEPDSDADQVGYRPWEPAPGTVMLTLGIPRGQVLLAGGEDEPEATSSSVEAAVGSGILSNPFLDHAFRTLSYRMDVAAPDDGSWFGRKAGVLAIPGRDEPCRHVDRDTLTWPAPPTPNPRARQYGHDGALPIGNLHEESGTLR